MRRRCTITPPRRRSISVAERRVVLVQGRILILGRRQRKRARKKSKQCLQVQTWSSSLPDLAEEREAEALCRLRKSRAVSAFLPLLLSRSHSCSRDSKERSRRI